MTQNTIGCDCRLCEALDKQAEPSRAIYYGVFFRNRNGIPRVATDQFWAEQKHAEMYIELSRAQGDTTKLFIGILSVPVSEVER